MLKVCSFLSWFELSLLHETGLNCIEMSLKRVVRTMDERPGEDKAREAMLSQDRKNPTAV